MSSDSRIHVVHVITQLELGGAQQNTLYTVRHLDRRVFAPALITGGGGQLDSEARAIPDLRLHTSDWLQRPLHPTADVRAFAELRRLLKHWPRPLIVHTHSSKAGVLGRLAARSVGADAVVHTVHGFSFHPHQPLAPRLAYTWIEAGLRDQADAYICVSSADRDLGLRKNLFGTARVELICSGIEFEQFAFDPDARRRMRVLLGLDATTRVVGTVANFKPQKAPLDFVALANSMLHDDPDLHFVFVGDGELRDAVQSRIDELSIGDRVHLLGWQRDIAACLSLLDCFVLTSLHEGLPRSVLQALASGLPVVATATGGTDEVLPAAQLARPGNISDLHQKTRSALDRLVGVSCVRRRPLTDNMASFSAKAMVLGQQALYLGLLGRDSTSIVDFT